METTSVTEIFPAEQKHKEDAIANIIPKSEDSTFEQEGQKGTSLRFASIFPQVWQSSTTDSNVSLHGFRRFKTSHLVNLRFMEEEIAKIDHRIYQAGLHLGFEPTAVDRLGLGTSKRDANFPKTDETVTPALVRCLRSMLKDYG